MHNVHAYMHQRRRVSGRQMRATDFPMQRPLGPRLPARRKIADARRTSTDLTNYTAVEFSAERREEGRKREEERCEHGMKGNMEYEVAPRQPASHSFSIAMPISPVLKIV